MANTELITTQTVGGNVDFGPFAIEYIDITDIKVSLDGVLQTLTTQYSIDSATSTVTFVTAPTVGAVIRIFRETPIETAKAILAPGSSIRAQNLNDNTEQALFAIQEIKGQYVTQSNGEFDTDVDLNNNRIINLADPVDPQDAVTKQYLEDNYFDDDTETILSSEAWPDNDVTIATTAAIDNRVDAKIDSAITGDIGTDGTGITVTNDGDGTITLGLGANSIDFDRIKNVDIITQAEQDAGSPAPADTNLFTGSAATKRFDTLVQTTTPSGSNWEVGKTWLQNDADLTLSIWDGSAWQGLASGGTFTNQPKVVYVDPESGDDVNDGHRISRPKATIRAAITQINADATFGDGSTVVLAPGIYAETFPIDINRNDVSIVGTSLRNCIIHPAIPVADQPGYDVDVPEANELTTMFRLNSGSYIANLTLMGMKAAGPRGGNPLDTDATFGLPTNQGWNFAFVPGATIRKSPYIQNCTNFSDSQINNVTFTPHVPGEGAAGDLDSAPTGGGILIDGDAVDANSPLRSMVCDSYTHTALDGPAIFVTNNGYCQATSSYAFFNHYHLKCLNGGQANLAASTSDFGRFSLIADGRSTTNIFTAPLTVSAGDGDITFTIGAPTADPSWHGSETRPQPNMLVELNGITYPILSSVANGAGWDVTISRPDPVNRSNNLGLNGAVTTPATAQFFLRSMIASSGHTMEYVGSGTNYTALPDNGGVPIEANQRVELNDGAIWTAITDHNGKFTVGDFFEIDQQLGFVTIPNGSIAFDLASDPSPQLGGDLDVNGQTITSASNGNIVIDPNGTGTISLGADTAVTGNITVSGTVDGRDVATDGAKLDGIESGATADQTAAEIRALVDSATDSNVFTDADHTKLDGIESGATADQTKADIDALNINADQVDGLEASQFIRADASDSYTGGLFNGEETITASAFDLENGHFWTCGAIAIPNPTNGAAGFSGLIRVTAAPTSFGSNWDFPGGSYTAPTTFPAVAPFYVVSSTQFYLGNWTEGIA